MDWLVWVKAFHIIFVVCWFSCIFYLPRLFINYVIADNQATRDQLCVMQRKLFRFSIPFVIFTLVTGITLVIPYAGHYLQGKWFYTKLLLVLGLVIYHFYCGFLVRQFARGENKRSDLFYRVFNELPVVVLFGAVILVVVRPF